MKLFKNWFKRKPTLRDRCVEAYGEEFGEIYDNMNRGVPVGDLGDTILYLGQIEEIRKRFNLK